MQATRRAILAASLVAMAGCGGTPGGETSTAEATVKGVVRLDGKPATEGEVIFDAGNYQRQVPQSRAPIKSDGTYEVKTLVGQNVVTLGGPLSKKYPVLQHKRKIFTANAGDNTFDYEAETK